MGKANTKNIVVSFSSDAPAFSNDHDVSARQSDVSSPYVIPSRLHTRSPITLTRTRRVTGGSPTDSPCHSPKNFDPNTQIVIPKVACRTREAFLIVSSALVMPSGRQSLTPLTLAGKVTVASPPESPCHSPNNTGTEIVIPKVACRTREVFHMELS
jgi:hypothetical protein